MRPTSYKSIIDPTKPLAQLMRDARAKKGLFLSQVEALTGVTKSHIGRIERGVVAFPSTYIAKVLGDFYGIDPAVIAGLKEPHVHEFLTILSAEVEDVKACKCGAWQLWRYLEDEDEGSIINQSDNA